MKLIAALAAAVITAAGPLLSTAASAADKPTFVFTAIPDQDEARLMERFG